MHRPLRPLHPSSRSGRAPPASIEQTVATASSAWLISSTTWDVADCVLVTGRAAAGVKCRPPSTISGSVAAGGVAREHGADRRIRIRADVLAVHEHVVGGVG